MHVEFLWYVAIFIFEYGVSFPFRIRILISYQRRDLNIVIVVRNFTEVFIYFISFMINII